MSVTPVESVVGVSMKTANPSMSSAGCKESCIMSGAANGVNRRIDARPYRTLPLAFKAFAASRFSNKSPKI